MLARQLCEGRREGGVWGRRLTSGRLAAAAAPPLGPHHNIITTPYSKFFIFLKLEILVTLLYQNIHLMILQDDDKNKVDVRVSCQAFQPGPWRPLMGSHPPPAIFPVYTATFSLDNTTTENCYNGLVKG